MMSEPTSSQISFACSTLVKKYPGLSFKFRGSMTKLISLSLTSSFANFKLSIKEPIEFSKDLSINQISLELNKLLEKMIITIIIII